MAQSYDIYIHSDQTSDSHPTRSTNEKQSSETKSFDAVNQTLGVLSNPDSLVASGINSVKKAIPEIAVAYAVLKVGEQVITTVESFKSITSGDYRFQNAYNNFKANINVLTNPFSTILNATRFNAQLKVSNDRLTQYRELTGDAIINSYGKGV